LTFSLAYVTIGYMQDRIEISQDTAHALLTAMKALLKEMTFISGSAYGLDSYRQACIAIAQAEKSAMVIDPLVPRKSNHDREGSD
jgi:protoheme ferro-lyase